MRTSYICYVLQLTACSGFIKATIYTYQVVVVVVHCDIDIYMYLYVYVEMKFLLGNSVVIYYYLCYQVRYTLRA